MGQVFPIPPGAAGRPILQMRNQVQRASSRSCLRELKRGDLNPTLTESKAPPRAQSLQGGCISENFHSFCLYFNRNPTLLSEKFPARNCFLGGSDTERSRQRGLEEGHGEQGKALQCTPRRVTQGAASPRGSCQLPNNEEQAARPKSGAKNPWNVRPRAAGHTECHLKEGFSLHFQGAVDAVWLPSLDS